jgi:hypothetical protein
MNTPIAVITHHTGGTDANPLADSSNYTVEQCDRDHLANPRINLGYPSSLGYYVGYHYYINKTGQVTQTRLHIDIGAHCFGMNKSSIGVCFAGNFDLTLPTQAQMEAWYKLYGDLLKKYPNIPTYPHRKYATKTCHGRLLRDDHFAVQYQIFSLTQKIAQLRALMINLITKRRHK